MNKKVGIIIIVIITLLGLAWFYQKQGLIEIFPTQIDRDAKRIAVVDESKFSPPDGLTDEGYAEKLEVANEAREKLLAEPDNAQLWLEFGNAVGFFNDYDTAVASWKKALEYQPQNFVAAANIAFVYQYFTKDFAQAEEFYLQALFARQDYTVAYQGLTDLYRYNFREKKDQLEPLLLSAMENDPFNAVSYLSELVDFFLTEDDLEKARIYYEQLKSRSAESAQRLLEKNPELEG